MKPPEPNPRFDTITGDDWKRSIQEARASTNEVVKQIRWMQAQKILSDFYKQESKKDETKETL